MKSIKKVTRNYPITDLVGRVFGDLKVISFAGYQNNRHYWVCKCKCGKTKECLGSNLIGKKSTSCGCSKRGIGKLLNEYDLSGDYGIGYTTKGSKFYFDLDDYDKIKSFCWVDNGVGYLLTGNENAKEANNKSGLMHRLILGSPANKVIDHINHQPFDNRKSNLRICDHCENLRNRKAKGYMFVKRKKKWMAQIKVNYKSIGLGYFDTEEEAKEARRKAEIKYFGEFQFREGGMAL